MTKSQHLNFKNYNMKKLFWLILFISVFFSAYSTPKIPVTKIELTAEEEINSTAENQSIFTGVEIIEYPEKVSLNQNIETLLFSCSDFSLSMMLKDFTREDKGFGDYYSYDLLITDSNSSKKILYSNNFSDYDLKSSKNNPLFIYKLLNKKFPVVKGDINNDGTDEYLFVISQLANKTMLAINCTGSEYKIILEQPVVAYGGPESDDVAETIIFNPSASTPIIQIDYAPYNKRAKLLFDKDSNMFIKEDFSYSHEMKLYKPFLPGKLLHFKNHDILLTDRNEYIYTYLKLDSDYYKIYFDGDPESWGLYKFIKDSIRVYDIDENSFAITMSYVNKDYDTYVPLYKDQIFFIKKANGTLFLYTVFNNNIKGYNHQESEHLEITAFETIKDKRNIYFDIINEETKEIVKSDKTTF